MKFRYQVVVISFFNRIFKRTSKASVASINNSLLEEKLNDYLNLISGDETLIIPACNSGIAKIYNAEDVFFEIEYNFMEELGGNILQPSTMEVEVEVYELSHKKANFVMLFSSLSSNLEDLAFKSQMQILEFARKHEKWLFRNNDDHYYDYYDDEDDLEKRLIGTLFLLIQDTFYGPEFFIISLHPNDYDYGQSELALMNFSSARKLPGRKFRVVVPKTKR